ncbi:MAG: pyrimidine dimer DNA glycosylase [Gemmatimonadetes bacterium]|nr:pyrimidine dimer DNA glycosylase [Gemmatimonadota bacterium]MYH19544.1 pyrimidine dimer DNA glycosylase [Gemmatimonadota bacterium]MYK98442.1 pyrimidine dimer DNA glycosylase [Gemmatimonadota bacterium]
MRIWDLPPEILCRQHLLGEHRELHGLWNVITLGKKGYREHPETKRWVGRLAALYDRHEALVAEMQRRGYRHNTPLDGTLADGLNEQDVLIDSLDEQIQMLTEKPCLCPIAPWP